MLQGSPTRTEVKWFDRQSRAQLRSRASLPCEEGDHRSHFLSRENLGSRTIQELIKSLCPCPPLLPTPFGRAGCILLILLTQLLHQDPLPPSHSLGDTRAPSRCAVVVFESFYPWSHTDFPGFRTVACAFLCLGVAGCRWRGGPRGAQVLSSHADNWGGTCQTVVTHSNSKGFFGVARLDELFWWKQHKLVAPQKVNYTSKAEGVGRSGEWTSEYVFHHKISKP